ncbi:MAG TPA: hypothetical protein VK131_11805, partial [Candidatus Acidoferrales bacterium]|nr:hypothetical protein [Candidatus Acidoferrales bacterium]
MPRPRLLVALAGGAALIMLTALSPLLWGLVAAYHGYLVLAAVGDAARLPRRGAFRAERRLPRPFSLGEEEEVGVTVEALAAAGLRARLADHAPPALAPRPREVDGRFDAAGRLAA